MEKFELFEKGSLGTCWYGKYHYLEPWAGCEHDCAYCYARHRGVVIDKLNELNAVFNQPKLLTDLPGLLDKIRAGIAKNGVKILKLSRYTDFFSPSFVKNGTSAAVLETICETSAERVIITTKGTPDENIIKIMKKHCGKISYNAAIKPENRLNLEKGAPSSRERVEAAEKIAGAGIKTTIHMDPLILGLDDLKDMPVFFDDIKKRGLNRVMFSFLLLNEPILDTVKTRIDKKSLDTILENFDMGTTRKYLPKQDETVLYSIKDEARKEYAEKLGEMLSRKGFDFVICSLKSNRGAAETRPSNCPACDGTFYA